MRRAAHHMDRARESRLPHNPPISERFWERSRHSLGRVCSSAALHLPHVFSRSPSWGPRRHEHGTQQEQRPPPRHAANGGARYEETREVTPERDEAREEVQCMRAHYREANLPRQSVVLSVGITGRE